jgi:hypothetical protein
MFEDIINRKKERPEKGCWNCDHAILKFISWYCQKKNLYKTPFDGADCDEYKEKNIIIT